MFRDEQFRPKPAGLRPAARPSTPRSAASSVVSRIRNYFLTGLILVGPLYITVQPDLVVHQLGRRCRAAVHSRRLPSRNLSAVPSSGLGPDHRVRDADAAWLPDRQLGRAQAGRVRRAHPQSHAGHPADLSQPEADLRDAVLEIRIELPPRRPGRVSGAGHVVDRVPVAAAERRRRRSSSRQPSTSRCSCRARPIRPPGSSSTCRAATSSSSTSRSRPR